MDKDKKYIKFDDITSQFSEKDFLRKKEPKFWDSKLNRFRVLSFFILLTTILTLPSIHAFNPLNSENYSVLNTTIQFEKTKIRHKINFTHLDKDYYIELAPRLSVYSPDNSYQINSDESQTKIKIRIQKKDVFSEDTLQKIQILIDNIIQSDTELSNNEILTIAEKLFA